MRPDELPHHLWLHWPAATCDIYLRGPGFEHQPLLHQTGDVIEAVCFCVEWADDRGLVATVRSPAEVHELQRSGGRHLTLRLYDREEFFAPVRALPSRGG